MKRKLELTEQQLDDLASSLSYTLEKYPKGGAIFFLKSLSIINDKIWKEIRRVPSRMGVEERLKKRIMDYRNCSVDRVRIGTISKIMWSIEPEKATEIWNKCCPNEKSKITRYKKGMNLHKLIEMDWWDEVRLPSMNKWKKLAIENGFIVSVVTKNCFCKGWFIFRKGDLEITQRASSFSFKVEWKVYFEGNDECEFYDTLEEALKVTKE